MVVEETVERRIVTVLFADLVGFTTLSEAYDPEDVASIQDAYFAMVRDTVARYGGRLEKFIGDAAMAVFGVPRSRDDDASRAVRAGLALVSGMQQLGAGLGLEDDVLQLRVGVNTGEAVTAAGGADEGRVTGDTVNTAARLQTAAPPGGVLVGEATALAVAETAEMEQVPPLELKGKAEPTPARLVTGTRAEPSRERAMGGLRAPTLGRERELADLMAAHGRALGGGVERWLIVAAPGVGKSRLMGEFADRIAATVRGAGTGTVTWRSRSRPESVSPFDPVARLLIDALGTTERAAAEQVLRNALTASGASEMRTRVVIDACLSVAFPASTGGDGPADARQPTTERDALFEAWLDGLDALAGTQTSVWLVEDVHWAGGDVLAFLDLAGSRAHPDGSGRLVIATARPSLLDAHSDWTREEPEAGRRVLQLNALEPADARALINALVGDALPEELVDRIAERSDGNCLFIEELLRTWVSVGTLVASADGGWRLAIAPDEIPLPQSVQSIYAGQLDDLPPDARRLARRASVAGRRFPLAALEPLGADSPHDEGLEPLQRRELVVGPVTEPLWGAAFAYRHALLRDAGYASLARAERARLHVRLARWLETAAGERSAEVAEQIARHYSSALDSAPALAREIGDGLDREQVRALAAEWFEKAGQGTLAVSAHDAARELLRRSIDLTPDDSALQKARRWERLGDATAFAADMDEGAAAYRRALELYRSAITRGSAGFDRGSDALTRASADMARGVEWLARISPEGAAALAEGAADLQSGSEAIQQGRAEFQAGMEAGLMEARSGMARAAASLADVMYQQLQFDEMADFADDVLTELGPSDAGSEARLLIARAKGLLGGAGPSPEVEQLMEEAARLADASGDRRTRLKAMHGLAAVHSESGHDDPHEWEALAERALEAEDWPMAVLASRAVAVTGIDDDAAGCLPRIARARDLAAAHGMTEDVGWCDYAEAEAALVSGDWPRALAAGARAMDVGETNAYHRLTVRTIHVVVPIAAVRGDRPVLERAARWYDSLQLSHFPDSPYARVVQPAQDIELATHGLARPYLPDVEPRLEAFRDEPGGPSWSAALDRVFRAWLDAGELDGAARAVAEMDAARPSFIDPSSLAIGTHELLRARLALARRERDRAQESAAAALARFRASSAPWWMAKAIRLLQRAGAADDELAAEVQQIELRLGAIGPTA